jgi:hypothetical protein
MHDNVLVMLCCLIECILFRDENIIQEYLFK